MGSGEKVAVVIAVLIALVIVVLIAAVIAGRFIMKGGGTEPTSDFIKMPLEMIDRTTGEIISQPLAAWEKDPNSPNYKNPQTQKYTMVEPMECASCGEKIPPPDYPAIDPTKHPSSDLIAEYKRLDAEYKCPKCNHSPFGGLVPAGN